MPRKVQSDAFFVEQIKKEHELMLDSLCFHAKSSDNFVLRAMNTRPVFNRPAAPYYTDPETEGNLSASLVDGEGGMHMLSRGMLPSMAPARYENMCAKASWNQCEERYQELQRELNKVKREITEKGADINHGHISVGGCCERGHRGLWR